MEKQTWLTLSIHLIIVILSYNYISCFRHSMAWWAQVHAVQPSCWGPVTVNHCNVTFMSAVRIPVLKSSELNNWALMDNTDCWNVAEWGVSSALLPASLVHEGWWILSHILDQFLNFNFYRSALIRMGHRSIMSCNLLAINVTDQPPVEQLLWELL